jgi:hypothetical protein
MEHEIIFLVRAGDLLTIEAVTRDNSDAEEQTVNDPADRREHKADRCVGAS